MSPWRAKWPETLSVKTATLFAGVQLLFVISPLWSYRSKRSRFMSRAVIPQTIGTEVGRPAERLFGMFYRARLRRLAPVLPRSNSAAQRTRSRSSFTATRSRCWNAGNLQITDGPHCCSNVMPECAYASLQHGDPCTRPNNDSGTKSE